MPLLVFSCVFKVIVVLYDKSLLVAFYPCCMIIAALAPVFASFHTPISIDWKLISCNLLAASFYAFHFNRIYF